MPYRSMCVSFFLYKNSFFTMLNQSLTGMEAAFNCVRVKLFDGPFFMPGQNGGSSCLKFQRLSLAHLLNKIGMAFIACIRLYPRR